MGWGDDLRPFLILTQAGLVTGIAAGLGYYTGRWADGRWGTGPWFSTAGALLGISAGLYEIFRQARKLR